MAYGHEGCCPYPGYPCSCGFGAADQGEGKLEQAEADRLEALSERYARGLWLVPLASGSWAVFDKKMRLVCIDQQLDAEKLRQVDFCQGEQWTAEQVAEMEAIANWKEPQVMVASKNAEDMGL